MDDILIGMTIGGYHILEEIGRGGMATVYRAHQISMNRDVAIKVLPPQFLHQSESLERFKQEASIVARLEHRAIVPVHDYGEYEGIPYIVMRYMDGGSVDQLLEQGPIPPDKTLSILEQIAPALDYAHREGVLHRDLKPSNILLDSNGDAYITDFGIARILGSHPKPLTTSGVVGTPSYMSPEQAQGHPLDGRSDLYALGVVLFEMLTGVRPFDGETPYSIAVKHVTEAPPAPCDINPKLPSAVGPVLVRTLAKTREARYPTAGELVDALKTAIHEPASLDNTPETEPSLNEALKAGALRRTVERPPRVLPPPRPSPPLTGPRPPVRPQIEVMPAYVPPSQSYTGALVKPRRRPKTQPGTTRLTWFTVAMVIGSLVLALGLASAYYIINWNDSPDANSVNYDATAIYKMTATKQAILAPDASAEADLSSPSGSIHAPTSPPTNTPRPSLGVP
jgi:serine/threonine-protein kinase